MREFKNPYYDGPECVCCKANKWQKDNESVVFLTERDYDQLSDAIKGEGENKQPTDTLCQQGIHSWTFGREVCLSCGIKGENK